MFIDTYRKEGALLTRAFGTEYPEVYSHPLREYHALVTNGGIIDLSHWAALRVTGSDRVRLINSLVTGNVATLETGQSCRTVMTTVKGKLMAELIVLARDEELMIWVMQGSGTEVSGAIEKHIIADDVTWQDASAEGAVFSIEGPNARPLLWRMFPEEPLPLEPGLFIDCEYQGKPVTVLSHSVTGEKGYHLQIPAGDGGRLLRNYMMQAARGQDIAQVGRMAWNMRRVENGRPWFGSDADVTSDNFPKESRLDDVVDYEKGCYLGQETLARMHHRGHPNWLLVGLVPANAGAMATPDCAGRDLYHLPLAAVAKDALSKDLKALDLTSAIPHDTELFQPATGGEESTETGGVKVAKKAVGRVTSAVFSPALGGPLMLGYVREKLAQPGNEFVLPLGSGAVTLVVTELPAGASI